MTVTLYSVSIPVLIHGLNNLSGFLTKAVDHAATSSTPLSSLLSTTLAPDMAALAFQIQRASDSAKGFPTRLGGLPEHAMPDTESTFEELQERITKTIELLKQVKEEDINGKEEVEVVIKTPYVEFKFTAVSYLLEFALPNFYFHVTTAYAILRHAGVPLGKFDFLGVKK